MRIGSVPFDHPDAVALRAAQEAFGDELYASDPASKHRFTSEVLDPASVLLTVVAYDDDGRPIGHASLRSLSGHGRRPGDQEDVRGAGRPGAASRTHSWPLSSSGPVTKGCASGRDHTGDRQYGALRLYERHGYTPIDVFPPYEAVTYSRCFDRVF